MRGSGKYLQGYARSESLHDGVVSTVADEPTQCGVAEDDLLGEPFGVVCQSGRLDLVLDFFREDCVRGGMAHDLDDIIIFGT